MKLKNNQLWKSLPADLKPHGFQYKLNKWYKQEGTIEACKNGFHGSKRIIDAMQYVDLEVLALAEVRGVSDKEDDKECWEEIKLVKAWKWEKKDSVELAIFAAELVIDIFEKQYPDDKRPREAIKAAKKWLKNPTEENRHAASASAAYAYASAASASASAYAYAAYAAARILDKCEAFIQKKIKNLKSL